MADQPSTNPVDDSARPVNENGQDTDGAPPVAVPFSTEVRHDIDLHGPESPPEGK